MEEAFQDLLRLIEEASQAWNCECVVTTRAYLKMAEAAAVGLLEHALDDDEYKRLRVVCDYSEKFCFQQKSWGAVVRFMINFWMGVEDGFFERTQVIKGGKYYERGYKIIRQ